MLTEFTDAIPGAQMVAGGTRILLGSMRLGMEFREASDSGLIEGAQPVEKAASAMDSDRIVDPVEGGQHPADPSVGVLDAHVGAGLSAERYIRKFFLKELYPSRVINEEPSGEEVC